MNLFVPLATHCERTSMSPWAEPFNTLSSFSFFLVGLYALMLVGAHRKKLGYTTEYLWMVFAIMMIGLSSVAFHVTAMLAANLMRAACVGLFLHLYTVFILRHIFGLSMPHWLKSFVALLSFCLSLSMVTDSSAMLASQAHLVSVLGFVAFLFALHHHEEPHRHLVLLAFVFYLFALYFRLADHRWCTTFPSGTYFLWHLFNLPVLALLMRFLVLNRASRFE